MSDLKIPGLGFRSMGGAIRSGGASIASLLDADEAYLDYDSSGIGYARFGVKRNGAGTSGGFKLRTLNAGSGVDAITAAADGTTTFIKGSRIPYIHTGNDAANAQLIFDGDSQTFGTGGAHPYPNDVTPTDTNVTYTKTNLGVPGETVATMEANAFAAVDAISTKLSRNIVILLGGINDIAGGANAETVFSRIRAYCMARRAAGLQVVVCTLLSAQGYETGREAVNVLLKSHWQEFADALADMTTNDNIGADGAWANGTYFNVDGIHPTTAGYAFVSAIVQNAVNALIAGTPLRGSWASTAVLGGDGGASGQTYTTRLATFEVNRRRCTAWFELLLSVRGTLSGTNAAITGLPFLSAAGMPGASCKFGYATGFASNIASLGGYLGAATSSIILTGAASVGVSPHDFLVKAVVGTNQYLVGEVSYNI